MRSPENLKVDPSHCKELVSGALSFVHFSDHYRITPCIKTARDPAANKWVVDVRIICLFVMEGRQDVGIEHGRSIGSPRIGIELS